MPIRAFALRTMPEPGARNDPITEPAISSSVARTKLGTGTPSTSAKVMPSVANAARTRTSTIFWLVKPDGKRFPLKSVSRWIGESRLTMKPTWSRSIP